MKISRKLNFVMQVEQDDGASLHVHCSPIPHAVFERYFMTLGKTFTAIYGSGLSELGGPRVAALMLRKVATEAGDWEGPEGVEAGLVGEINRRSNIITMVAGRWQSIPLEVAIGRDLMTEEELSEVQNAIVFFIVVSSVNRKKDRAAALQGLSIFWGAQTTSSNATEFASSLPTSTRAETSGEKDPPAQVTILGTDQPSIAS